MAAQNYSSNAPETSISGGITNASSSFSVADGTGWPTANFVATLERETSKEEQIFVTTRSGNNFTGVTRGFGSTTAVAHNSGAVIEHTFDAASAQRHEDHIFLAAAAHAASAISNTPAGTIAATTVQNALNELDTEKAIDSTVVHNSLFDASTMLIADVDNTPTPLTVAASRFVGRKAAGGIAAMTVAEALALLNLTSASIPDFTEASQDVIGALTGYGGSGLAYSYNDAAGTVTLDVNVDASTIEINADTLRLKDGGITLAKLAAALQAFLVPTGTVAPFAGASAPTGWLICDATPANRTTFATLFALIGTTYGAGDGSTTFGLPDLRGRVVAGKEASQTRLTAAISGINGGTLGAAGGHQDIAGHSHSTPNHAHALLGGAADVVSPGVLIANTTAAGAGLTATDGGGTSGVTGTGTAANVPPTMILNYIIKT